MLIARNQAKEIATQLNLTKLYAEYSVKVEYIVDKFRKENEVDDVMMLVAFNVLLAQLTKLIDEMYAKIIEYVIGDITLMIKDNYFTISSLSGESFAISASEIEAMMFNQNASNTVIGELNLSKQLLMKELNASLFSITESDYNSNISDIIYSRRGNHYKGDLARVLRIHRTESTRLRTLTKLNVLSKLKSMGYRYKRSWLYTWESSVPRIHHVESDGLLEDDNGFFNVNGKLTRGPGLFGEPSEDINCNCDTSILLIDRGTNV